MILAVITAVLVVLFVILIKYYTKEHTQELDASAVIFVTHNDEDCLEYMVRRTLRRYPHASVRIIDDGSEDDTRAIAVRLAREEERVEFGDAAR